MATAYVQLISITCERRTEWTKDEPFLKVNNRIVWEEGGVEVGDQFSLTGLPSIQFDDVAVIELRERDPWSPDDSLGKVSVLSSQAGNDEKTAIFDRDGKYRLKYKIVAETERPIQKEATGAEQDQTGGAAVPPDVVVTRENSTGRNLEFVDTRSRRRMTIEEFCDAIEAGEYSGYHVRHTNWAVSQRRIRIAGSTTT